MSVSGGGELPFTVIVDSALNDRWKKPNQVRGETHVTRLKGNLFQEALADAVGNFEGIVGA